MVYFNTNLYIMLPLYQGRTLRHTTISGSTHVAEYNTDVRRSQSDYIT